MTKILTTVNRSVKEFMLKIASHLLLSNFHINLSFKVTSNSSGATASF